MTNIHKTGGRESMKHLTTEWPLLKELEEQLVRTLQKVFAVLLAALLEEIDQQLAEARDKRRYQLKDKRPTTIQTLFGEVTFRRNYYYDRQTGNYTFLLDAE
ncbi:ISLre2 family transposase, partial [Geobacillus stearothermophilus]